MQRLHPTPSQTLAHISNLKAGDHVATDADGTLWAADVGDDTVRWAANAELDAYLALIERDYHAGCRAAAEYLRGRDREAVIKALMGFLGPRLAPRKYLIDALIAAEKRGVDVRIVTASPRWSAEAGARLLGVDWPVIGIETQGQIPGQFVEPVSVEAGKPAAWRALDLPQPALALGDSKWDLPLLESACVGLRLQHAARETV